MRFFVTIAFAAALVHPLLPACAEGQRAASSGEAAEADRDAVRAVGERWRMLYRQGRFSEIPDLYTLDTLVMPRGRPAIVGREEMRRAIGGLAAGRRVEIDVREREITLLGDHAVFIGDFTVTYTPKAGDTRSAVTEEGRSFVVFRRDDDGVWRIHRDMDSPAPPRAAEQAGTTRSRFSASPAWDGTDRSAPTDCDRLASSRYDRLRLASPLARSDIDVPAAIAQCRADLALHPDDPRIHFHLGRLYGYSGERELSRASREAAARAGNHNAIFLLGYLDWLTAEDDAAKCQAAADMRLAADRGNYSAQVTYSAFQIEGKLSPCGEAAKAPIGDYLSAAGGSADGYFERLLVSHLQASTSDNGGAS
ncbi:MAG: YybH family protein [Erythrobacter sp.]